MGKTDHCTGWPEQWAGVDISDCCQKHDVTLSTRQFYNCLAEKIGWFHASYITLGGAIGGWVRYPIEMWRRV